MTIEKTRVIDFIADDVDDGIASLVITDHLEWDATQPTHLVLLQEKINTYITFFESGEIFENREHLRNRRLRIKVIGLYPLSSEAQAFYKRAGEVLRSIGLDLEFELTENALD